MVKADIAAFINARLRKTPAGQKVLFSQIVRGYQSYHMYFDGASGGVSESVDINLLLI